jgi:alpha-beta hydrolase superfamily lysophospholipase
MLNEKSGALVCGLDLEGHGHSTGDRAVLNFPTTVEDLHQLVAIARRETGQEGLPVILVGHSMGGLLTARYVQTFGTEAQVKGAVFLGAVLGSWDWLERTLASCPSELEFIPNSAASVTGMSRRVDTQESYQKDPLVYHGAVPLRLIQREGAELEKMRSELSRLKIPMLVLHGSDDPFVPFKNSLSAILNTNSDDLAFRVYPGARHELVNESNQQEVFDDIHQFVQRVIKTSAK